MEDLKNDILHATKKSLINFDKDAASCYDRIIFAIASILGRRHGLHCNVIFVNASTLQQAKYKLPIAMGISEDYYTHSHAFPIYGTWQGRVNSPVIWCIISSTLFKCHESKSHGATFSSPDKSTSVWLSMVGFVDDSTGQVNHFKNPIQPNPEELSAFLQHGAKLWNDLLWMSGGLLEVSKCLYHYLHFDFNANGNASPRLGPVSPPITIPDSKTQANIMIPAKSVVNPHKSLGHYKAPAGNSARQLRVLKEKSNKPGQQVSTGPFNWNDSRTFYRSIYQKAMGYVLPQSFFTKHQLKTIQTAAMSTIVAKCGYYRKTIRAVIYGPSTLAGATFLELYTHQGTGQIMLFLKFW
jgi:hypothetical protein